ncbi:MAG: hypothetical protein LBV45_05460 [Xanthomonadaceae bacterium]|jgi:hypothetical protein|nr:hypothetical protein [Xanthomonadaceae bacterium]
MRRNVIAIAFAALIAAIALSASATGPAREDFSGLIYADPDNYPIAHIEPFHYKQFSMMEREMQYLVYADGDHRITNHFCVVGYRLADGRTEAVVIWKEKNLLFPWGGGNPEAARERFRRAFSLAYSKRIGEENLFDRYPDEPPYAIGGDKLATRTGFYGTIADCERHGTQHRIYPFMPPADEED